MTCFFRFFLFVVVTCGTAYSETDLKLSDIQETNFSTILVEDARVLADSAGNTGIGAIAHEFVRAAMESGRVDLIELCWENRHVSALFFNEYQKMPDGYLKDQLFSSRLRNPRIPWPDDRPGETSSGNGTERMSLVEWYIPIFRKYIPDLPKNYSEIGSREKRLKLADVFDKAVGIPIVVEPEARRVWPPSQSRQHEASSVVPASPTAAGASTVAPGSGGETVLSRNRSFVWFSVFAAALVGVAAWLILRSRPR